MAGQHHILIIGPAWVGDMVMAQSLFIALKQLHPDCQIDVLAPAWTRPLLERMPEVRKALDMPITHGVFGWRARRQIGRALRGQYQQAIVLPNSWKSALIPWFAQIPVRTGWKGEMRYGLMNDLRHLDKTALPLMVERFVSLAYPSASATQAPQYPLPKMIANKPRADIEPVRKTDQSRLVLCPGAEFGPAKQWPPAYYAELAQNYADAGWQVLILGSKADVETGQEIVQKAARNDSVISLCGQTKLADAIDLIGTADQVVTNDSGLMHIAAALQKPMVVIYGPTSPGFTPPLSDKAHIVQIPVDCGPCFQRVCPEGHHKCMRDISVDKVMRNTSKGKAIS